MSRGVNKVILLGHCGQNPQVKDLPSGEKIVNISIATGDTWKDSQTGERKERTEWHRVVFFNRLAEIGAQYLQKGRNVYIEGNIRTRKWTDNNGQDRFTTEIVARELQLLDSNSGQHESDTFKDSSVPIQRECEMNSDPKKSSLHDISKTKTGTTFDFEDEDPFGDIPF